PGLVWNSGMSAKATGGTDQLSRLYQAPNVRGVDIVAIETWSTVGADARSRSAGHATGQRITRPDRAITTRDRASNAPMPQSGPPTGSPHDVGHQLGAEGDGPTAPSPND